MMNERLRELHLFAGCGGGVLGSKLIGNQVIGYVEREPYRCRTLAQRIKDGILDDAPIYCGTVREFIDLGYAARYRGLVDVLCAGFPCPPFSLAGKRLGGDDPRNGWPETIDAIRIIQPRFCFLENVPGLVTSPYLETICRDIHEAGYKLRATVLGGIDVGAPHVRKRFWMLAYPNDMGCKEYARAGTVPTQHPPLSACVQFPTPSRAASRQGQNEPDGRRGQTLVGAARGQLFQSPMPSDVRGGRTTKGSKRPNESGLRKQLFPTPRSEDGQSCGAHHGKPDTLTGFMKLWPTPKASSAGPDFAKLDRSATGISLQTAVAQESTGGTLNPNWVEWLMGWPIGWTDLKPLATGRFQEWWRQHGKH